MSESGYSQEVIDILADNCVPSPGRIAVLLDTPETMTEAGLHLGPSANQADETGLIFRVGTPLDDFPHAFEAGQRAFFAKYSGSAIDMMVGEKKISVTVMSAQDVMATITKGTKIKGVVSAAQEVSS